MDSFQVTSPTIQLTGNTTLALTGTAGTGSTDVLLDLTPTYNQTGSAAATDILVNRTETAVGSGAQRFVDLQVGGVSKANIDRLGNVSAASYTGSGSGLTSIPQAGVTGLVSQLATLAPKVTGVVNAESYGLVLGTSLSNASTNTTALNAAIAALPNGGVVLLPTGVIVFTSLTIPAEIPITLQGTGVRDLASYGVATGTELRSTIANGTTPAITIAAGGSGDSAAKVCLRDFYLRCSGDPSSAGIGTRGNSHGISIVHTMHGEISNVYVAGFDGHGIHIDNGYWWLVSNVFASGCGVGFSGTNANTTLMLNCRADFNTIGVQGIQRCVSLSCESNTTYGFTASGAGLDYSLHDCWFENNAAGGTGADIFVDQAALLSLSGHIRMSGKSGSSYSIKATNYASVIVNGVLRLFYPSPANTLLLLDSHASLTENVIGNSFLGYVSTANGATYVASAPLQTEVAGGANQDYMVLPPGAQFIYTQLPTSGYTTISNIFVTGNIPLGFECHVRVATTSTSFKFDGSGNIRGNGGVNYTPGAVGELLSFYWQFPYWHLTSISKLA